MKSVSILLKIIAILAAAAALYFVYAKNKQLNDSIATFNQTLAPHTGSDETIANPASVITVIEKGKADAKDLAKAKEDITSLNSANNGLTEQLEQVKNENKATGAELKKIKNSHSKALSELTNTKSKLNDTTKKHNDISQKYAALNAEYAQYRSQNKASDIDDLKSKVNDLMQQLQEKEDALVRAVKRAGGQIIEKVEQKVARAKLVEGIETEVLKFDWRNNFIALDKGTESGVIEGEEISIYDGEGNLACVVSVEIAGSGISLGAFSKSQGNSPSIFVGNKYTIKAKK